jgi:hypothetical protein
VQPLGIGCLRLFLRDLSQLILGLLELSLEFIDLLLLFILLSELRPELISGHSQ